MAADSKSKEQLTREEQKSVTHGDFWIPEVEREKYKLAVQALNRAGVPFVVTGAYAIYEYTGIYRETKDLDLFVQPNHLVEGMAALREQGFVTRLEQPHWLAKATLGEHFVDMIFGMGNGLALVDEDWYTYSRPGIFAAEQARIAPVEELIWHRLFINERHRQDMADIVHLILCHGDRLDWQRILDKTGTHWPLLLAQLQMFQYVYPQAKNRVPPVVLNELLDRAREEVTREPDGEASTRGTLISRFSFAIDINEWGLRDLRSESIALTQQLPIIEQIARSDVWDEKSDATLDFLERLDQSAS